MKTKKGRLMEGSYIIEGPKLVEEALLSGVKIKTIFYGTGFAARLDGLMDSAAAHGAEVIEFADDVFDSLCDTVTSQGVAAEAELPTRGAWRCKGDYVLLLSEVSDPGNLGTIIRTAAASGVKDVICSPGCADIYSPKVIRSAAGAVFRLNISEGVALSDALARLDADGFTSLAAVLRGDDYFDVNFDVQKIALIIGNEAHGIADDIVGLATHRVTLPMRGNMESLNAAMAAGILLYDIFRLREGF